MVQYAALNRDWIVCLSVRHHLHCLSPRYMYWSDWSDRNPSIKKAWMDGTHNVTLVSGTGHIHWPNGLAIDEQLARLYWTDAYLEQICYVDLTTGRNHILVRNPSLIPHPYSIAVYKVSSGAPSYDDQLYCDISTVILLCGHKNAGNLIELNNDFYITVNKISSQQLNLESLTYHTCIKKL